MTTKNYSKTDEVIASMLVENTGTHMLDSGGSSGRMWQRNQAAVGEQSPVEFFSAQPFAKWFDVRVGYHYRYDIPTKSRWSNNAVIDRRKPAELEMSALVHVFHFLTDCLDFDEAADTFFDKWGTEGEREHEPWLALMSDFPEAYAAHLAREEWAGDADEDEDGFTNTQIRSMSDEDIVSLCPHYVEPKGIYGDGEPMIEYTYNYENSVSQDYQFAYASIGDTVYIAVSIHGGADARGGFTKPRIFTASDYDGTGILDAARNIYAYCDGKDCDAAWYSDDSGSHWYEVGNGGGEDDLDCYEAREGDANTAFLYSSAHPIGQEMIRLRKEHLAWKESKGHTVSYHEKKGIDNVGYIVVEETPGYGPNIAYCPTCGTGHIQPSWSGNG